MRIIVFVPCLKAVYQINFDVLMVVAYQLHSHVILSKIVMMEVMRNIVHRESVNQVNSNAIQVNAFHTLNDVIFVMIVVIKVMKDKSVHQRARVIRTSHSNVISVIVFH